MTQSIRHKILVILLGLFVTLSMGLAAVHASAMAVDMAMADGMANTSAAMGTTQKIPCNDCLDGKSMTKGMLCASSTVVAVTVSQEASDFSDIAMTGVASQTHLLPLRGRAYPPDPYPPKNSNLI